MKDIVRDIIIGVTGGIISGLLIKYQFFGNEEPMIYNIVALVFFFGLIAGVLFLVNKLLNSNKEEQNKPRYILARKPYTVRPQYGE